MADKRLTPERRQHIENLTRVWGPLARDYITDLFAEIDRLTVAVQVHHASGCPWYENDAALHAAVGLASKPGPTAVPPPATIPLSANTLKLYREWVERPSGANPYVHVNNFEALMVDYERLAAELREYKAANPPASDDVTVIKRMVENLAIVVGQFSARQAPPADPTVHIDAEIWKERYELKAAEYKQLKTEHDQMENDFHDDFERQNKKIAELEKELAAVKQQTAKPVDPLAAAKQVLLAMGLKPTEWSDGYRWWDGKDKSAGGEDMPSVLYEALLRHEGMSADREAVQAWAKCLIYRTAGEAWTAAAAAFNKLAPTDQAELVAANS